MSRSPRIPMKTKQVSPKSRPPALPPMLLSGRHGTHHTSPNHRPAVRRQRSGRRPRRTCSARRPAQDRHVHVQRPSFPRPAGPAGNRSPRRISYIRTSTAPGIARLASPRADATGRNQMQHNSQGATFSSRRPCRRSPPPSAQPDATKCNIIPRIAMTLYPRSPPEPAEVRCPLYLNENKHLIIDLASFVHFRSNGFR
jgi:hypothetical protein